MLNNFNISKDPIAIIFGNEVDGVNNDVINLCNEIIEIPQFGTKHSLNISVSSGIVIWELWNKLVSFKN
jgi:tRNA G18 (ribose-2'-O)-methylase SpoU